MRGASYDDQDDEDLLKRRPVTPNTHEIERCGCSMTRPCVTVLSAALLSCLRIEGCGNQGVPP
jgi:hypothetical protein